MARLFDCLSFRRFARRGHGGTDRGPILDQADPDPLEILQEPIMIESERTNDIRPPGESDDPDRGR